MEYEKTNFEEYQMFEEFLNKERRSENKYKKIRCQYNISRVDALILYMASEGERRHAKWQKSFIMTERE